MVNQPTDINYLLPLFLRHLAEQIDNGSLSDDNLQRVGEFFMSYLFENETREDENYSDSEFYKFVIMGWWVYTQIRNV